MTLEQPFKPKHYRFVHVIPGVIDSWHRFRAGYSDERLREVAFDAFNVSEGAASFFRGLFPQDLPYFPNESYLLPWHKKHWKPHLDGDSLTQQPIQREVDEYVGKALEIAKSEDGGEGEEQLNQVSYLAGSYFEKAEQPEAEMKVYSALAMMSSDQAVNSLVDGDFLEAMIWLSQAYKSLIDCTAAAERILGFATDKARASALVRHTENHAMKKDVFNWLDVNMHRFGSMESAAEAVFEQKLVPVKFRTVRQWITDWSKARRAVPNGR